VERRIFQGMNTQTTHVSKQSTRWMVDPLDTTVGFSIRHFMVTNVRGVFEQVQGTVEYDPRRPKDTVVNVTIPVASINTRDARRDAHLRDADFFDAERFPTMSFRSTLVATGADGRLTLTGDLSLRGITRPLILAVSEVTSAQKDHNGVPRIGASATGKIRRSDFGITYNLMLDAGGVALADEVLLSVELSLMKTAAQTDHR
jgi:polyisoprenoid-binding protein YceI